MVELAWVPKPWDKVVENLVSSSLAYFWLDMPGRI